MSGAAPAATTVLQAGIVATTVVGVRRGNLAAAVNGVAMLGATLLPAAARVVAASGFGVGVDVPPVLGLWVATAGVLHQVGMLGAYDTTWWWDHLTHTVSAALVAAGAYAWALLASGGDPVVAGAATVTATVALGLLWEVLELLARDVGDRLGVDPVLVHYGWDDTALDVGFDAAGALLVVALDVRLLVPLFEPFPRDPGVLAAGLAALVVTSTAGLALYLGRYGG